MEAVASVGEGSSARGRVGEVGAYFPAAAPGSRVVVPEGCAPYWMDFSGLEKGTGLKLFEIGF